MALNLGSVAVTCPNCGEPGPSVPLYVEMPRQQKLKTTSATFSVNYELTATWWADLRQTHPGCPVPADR